MRSEEEPETTRTITTATSDQPQQRVILYPQGGYYNRFRSRQTFLSELMDEFQDFAEASHQLGCQQAYYIQTYLLPRIPGGVWLYCRDPNDATGHHRMYRLDPKQASEKLAVKMKSRNKYKRERLAAQAATATVTSPTTERPSNKRRVSIEETVRAFKKRRKVGFATEEYEDSKPKSSHRSEMKRLRKQIQFLSTLYNDQKRQIEYLTFHVTQMEAMVKDGKGVDTVEV